MQRVAPEDWTVKLSFDFKDDQTIKILDLHWDPSEDIFSYYTAPVSNIHTKRTVLPIIARLYDLLGALDPVTFWAKCFI